MPAQCPTTGGAMIEIAGVSYCVDATEVTEAQYQGFLSTNPDPASQIAACSPNASFAPSCNFDPANDPEHPVVCVDWCDAYAFCEHVGKRLCGNIGGGANPTASAADAAQSQWYRACSEAGARVFPYGDAYDGDKCNGLDAPFTGTIDVGLLVQCVGGYPGLFDMSGNAREWEDSCDAAGCVQRGGSWLTSDTSSPHSLRCDSSGKGPRSQANNEIGFRCCADLP
jgi:formylglycine-generating enzyme required for sulfatase activity